ncbi:hypothetical protein CFOL_v3_01157 [Cephalotus follicularis]|uniref:Uncharacterized protein n=1 Tax=Cephalotus follicularis TaxID=3775 RepID=A0A1Q3APQ5_CEPFO|nr:hypothetical protein CFOL_v3_01157 [Cephalotus follicularis]
MSDSTPRLPGSPSSPFGASSIFEQMNNSNSDMSSSMHISTSPSTGLSGPTQASTSLFTVPFHKSQISTSASGSSIVGRKHARNSSNSLDTSGQSCAATTASAFCTTITQLATVCDGSSTLLPAAPGEIPSQVSSISAAASSFPTFGSSETFAFGSGASRTLGYHSATVCSTSASGTFSFGVSTPPVFGFCSTSAFCQSTSACAHSGASVAGASSAASFTYCSTSPFRQFNSSSRSANVAAQRAGGLRLAPFITEKDVEDNGEVECILAMSVYKNKSPEELRLENYQSGDRGGPAQPSAGIDFGTSACRSPFGVTSAPFSSSSFGALGNHFAMTSSCAFGVASCPAFGATSNPFCSTTFGAPFSSNRFSTTASSTAGCYPALEACTSPSPFNAVSSYTIGTSVPYGQASAPGAAHILGPGFNFVNAQPLLLLPVHENVAPAVHSVAPYIGQSLSTGVGHMFTNTPMVLPPSNVVALGSNQFLILQPAIGTYNVGVTARPPAGSNGSSSGS